MRLKYLALTCLMAYAQIGATPPRLGWEMGWCWDNTLVQLLYNMRGMTLHFLDNVEEFSGKSALLEKYIELIAAIRKNPDGYFLEEMRNFHAPLCKLLNCSSNTCKSIRVGFKKVAREFSCCTLDLGVIQYTTSGGSWEGQPLFVIAPINRKEKLTVAERIAQMTPLKGILTAPNYLIVDLDNAPSVIKVTDELIDIASILPSKFKTERKVWNYELIGVSVGIGMHEVAYIKDQWDVNPSWYYCDDMAPRGPGGMHQKLDTLPELGDVTEIELLVYKRVDSAGQNKPQVTGDDKDLEKLVQALSLLRSL